MSMHGLALIIKNGMICNRMRELAFGVFSVSLLHWFSGIMRSFLSAIFLPVSMFCTTHFSIDSSMTIPLKILRWALAEESLVMSLRTRIDWEAFILFGESVERVSSIRTI